MGDYDAATKKFTRRRVQAVDYGIDFYAMQTLLTPDGRRVMIAWMQNWNTVGAKLHGLRWFGQTTLARELHIRDGHLIQTPVRELEQHRGRPVIHHHIPVSGEINLPGVQGRILDMTVDIEPIGKDSYRCFRLHVAKNGECVTTIRYRPDQSTLKIDRSRSGLHHDIVHTRSFFVRRRDGALRLRVILDRFSVEVFVNDGEQAASAVLYTPLEANAISFEADGAVMMNVEKYDLIFEETEPEPQSALP